MRFDLERWGDGTLHLVHWDSLHGDDVVIEIEKGAAYLHRIGANSVDGDKEINLVAFLEKLADRAENF